MARKAVIAAACILVTGLCTYMVLRPAGAGRRAITQDDHVPWVCDACGHRFSGPPYPGKRPCPDCGRNEAVRSIVFVCGKCGEEFEAYRLFDNYSTEAGPAQSADTGLPLPHVKRPGGRWTADPAELDLIACPRCRNDDPATLAPKARRERRR